MDRTIQHREFPDKAMPTTDELREASFDMMMESFHEALRKVISELSEWIDSERKDIEAEAVREP